MVKIEKLAQAVLEGEALQARSLTQDLFRSQPRLTEMSKPSVNNPTLLSTAAALVELFAMRWRQEPPAWTATVGGLENPIFLVKSAARMKRLRELCETQSPEPLRKRGLYAPSNYLEFA